MMREELCSNPDPNKKNSSWMVEWAHLHFPHFHVWFFNLHSNILLLLSTLFFQIRAHFFESYSNTILFVLNTRIRQCFLSEYLYQITNDWKSSSLKDFVLWHWNEKNSVLDYLEIKYDTPSFPTLTQRYASENYLVKDIQV